ncbi:MAG: phosphatase domain-containing protein [Verrucomicrobiota bacterium]
MTSGNPDFIHLLRRTANALETRMDQARHRLSRTLGTSPARQLAAYVGYSAGGRIHVSGRVLANAPYGGPLEHDGWWENLANTFRRWESDEVPGASVTLRSGSQELTVLTDEEGFYQASFPCNSGSDTVIEWRTVEARTQGKDSEIEAAHPVMIPPREAEFGIISDLDDTVIHTGITSLLLAAKLTFLENAKTRKPLDGVAKLYQSFQRGFSDGPVNPLFYLSSSPWNLHDLLGDFLRLNEIPAGPLFLRDLGLDDRKFVTGKGHGHKLDQTLELMAAYPALQFVLVGDSGQQDASIYAEVAKLRPGRVRAIYIRDVDPGLLSNRDAAVEVAVELAAACGVPMILAADSEAIAEHARRIGLIPAKAEAAVSIEVATDQHLPETGEQAVKDAVDSILPGLEDKPGREKSE